MLLTVSIMNLIGAIAFGFHSEHRRSQGRPLHRLTHPFQMAFGVMISAILFVGWLNGY